MTSASEGAGDEPVLDKYIEPRRLENGAGMLHVDADRRMLDANDWSAGNELAADGHVEMGHRATSMTWRSVRTDGGGAKHGMGR